MNQLVQQITDQYNKSGVIRPMVDCSQAIARLFNVECDSAETIAKVTLPTCINGDIRNVDVRLISRVEIYNTVVTVSYPHFAEQLCAKRNVWWPNADYYTIVPSADYNKYLFTHALFE